MKIKYLTALVASSVLTVGVVSLPVAFNPVQAAPCAAPCAANPCAANPCAANPCAADPCAASPCAANPCAASPCAANPCAANPCAANPCAADPCAAVADVVTPHQPPHKDVYVEKTSRIAIRGADPVAYFTESKAVPGSSDHRLIWNGAVWYFSSEANKNAFKADPLAYAPQYGGYCAKALSEGNLASIDPRAWKIVDGKLYLNYSADVQAQWVQDIPGNIQKADDFWPSVLSRQTFWENQIAWAQ